MHERKDDKGLLLAIAGVIVAGAAGIALVAGLSSAEDSESSEVASTPKPKPTPTRTVVTPPPAEPLLASQTKLVHAR